MGSPHKDYTVKVYSKHDLEVTNSNGETNQLHTDGQSPSEFTSTNYCGMNIDCTPNKAYEAVEKLAEAEASDEKWWLKPSKAIEL